MAARQATAVDLPALQNASRVLLDQLARDAQSIPDYGDSLTACKSSDFAPYARHLDSSLFRQLGVMSRRRTAYFRMIYASHIRKNALWEYPTVYFNTMTVRIKVVSSYFASHSASGANVNSHMGLIPEIERVWISIDHKLFLWDYVDGSVDSKYSK